MKNLKTALIFLFLIASPIQAANEIHIDYQSGQSLYATVRNGSGQVWYPVIQEFEAWGTGSRDADDYDLGAMTDSTGNRYVDSFDTNISGGLYTIQVWEKAGANPDESADSIVGSGEIAWNGSAEETIIDSAGRTDVGNIEGSDATDAINAEADTAISDASLATAANLAVVDTNVDDIETDTGTTLPAALSTIEGKIDTVDDYIDNEIAAIKAKTDLLSFTGNDVIATLDSETVQLSSAGLDLISAADPGGVATTYAQMQVQLWRRFFKKFDRTETEMRSYDDTGNVVRTTQTWSSSETTQTIGAAQ